jgi:hypothetical protein
MVIGRPRLLAGAREIALDDRVQGAVELLDAADVHLGQLARGDRARPEVSQELGGSRERIHGTPSRIR